MTVVHLVPATAPLLDAALAGDDALAAAIGAPVAPGWAGFPEALPALRDAAPAGAPPDDAEHWGSHLFLAGDPTTVVGLGGFYGPPSPDGTVEIGYAVAPAHQGRGLATAAVDLLVEQAAAAGVEDVLAHTLAEENASVAVLRRAGFALDGTEVDPDEGEVWRWRRYVGRTST